MRVPRAHKISFRKKLQVQMPPNAPQHNSAVEKSLLKGSNQQ
jgi:hypothetical protein